MILKGMLGSVVLAGLAAVAAINVVGLDSAITTVAAWRNRAREAWEGDKSEIQQAAEIGVRIDQLRNERTRVGKNLAAIEVKLDDCGARAKRIENELEQEEELLARARGLLASAKDEFVIGGRTYAPADVSADASARLEHCQRLQVQLAQVREQSKQLTAVLRDGQEAVREAHEQEQTLQARLDSLRTRLDQAQLRQRMADLTAGLRGSSEDRPAAKLLASLESLDTKVRVLEREIGQDAARETTGLIDWDGKRTARTSREIRTSIDLYFDRQDGANVDRQPTTR